MKFANGTFTGTGASKIIDTVGFKPELVIIRVNSATALTSTSFRVASMTGDKTASLFGSIANFAGGITSLNENGFTVGTGVECNENLKTVYWVAFAKDGSNDFDTGTYVGNAIAGRTIAVNGFDPGLVVTKKDSTSLPRWKIAANITTDCLSFENNTILGLGTNLITAFSTGGGNTFTLGSETAVNANTLTFYWFAFKTNTQYFTSGTYVGTGSSLDITGLEFTPVMAWIKVDFTDNAVQRVPDQTGTDSWKSFGAGVAVGQVITSFNGRGFTVGTDQTANNSGKTFYYAVWGRSLVKRTVI